MSIVELSRFGSSLAVFDCTTFGASLSLRSYFPCGSSLAVMGISRMCATLSILGSVSFGSSLALRSFFRLGSTMSCLGARLHVEGDLTVNLHDSTNGFQIYQSTRRLSFPPESAKDGSGGYGIFHGAWFADLPLATSDRRLKQNVVPLRQTLEGSIEELRADKVRSKGIKETPVAWTLRELRPVSFHFKTSSADAKEPSGRMRMGFVAQEVEKILPNLVQGDRAGQMKALLYQDLVAVVTAAMQEQRANLDKQDAEVIEAQVEAQLLLDEAELLSQQLDVVEEGMGLRWSPPGPDPNGMGDV